MRLATASALLVPVRLPALIIIFRLLTCPYSWVQYFDCRFDDLQLCSGVQLKLN